MMDFTLDKWQHLPRVGKIVGTTGQPVSGLWEWVEADILEYLINLGQKTEARELDCTIGNLVMISFYYYLLHIREYTTKAAWNNSKQVEEFKMGDITFFKKEKQGNL
jgi:hypothetical protein